MNSDEWYQHWRKQAHGLHVLDELVEGCKPCAQRAAIMVMARLMGLDPQKALEDADFCAEWGGKK